MSINIRFVQNDDDLQRVARFRYEIYVEEMGRVQEYADPDSRTIVEPFDVTGQIVFAEEAGRIVGTVRTNFGRDTDLGFHRELYGMECAGSYFPQFVSVTTKLMVAPHLRHTTLAFRLCTALYRFAVPRGILFDFIDCNPHLEKTFQRLGHRRYRSRIRHPEYGDVLPLVLLVTDLDYLISVGSPWARICRELLPHLAANRLLQSAIQTYQDQGQTLAA